MHVYDIENDTVKFTETINIDPYEKLTKNHYATRIAINPLIAINQPIEMAPVITLDPPAQNEYFIDTIKKELAEEKTKAIIDNLAIKKSVAMSENNPKKPINKDISKLFIPKSL